MSRNTKAKFHWSFNVRARRYFAIFTIVVRRTLHTATRQTEEWFFSNTHRGVQFVLQRWGASRQKAWCGTACVQMCAVVFTLQWSMCRYNKRCRSWNAWHQEGQCSGNYSLTIWVGCIHQGNKQVIRGACHFFLLSENDAPCFYVLYTWVTVRRC